MSDRRNPLGRGAKYALVAVLSILQFQVQAPQAAVPPGSQGAPAPQSPQDPQFPFATTRALTAPELDLLCDAIQDLTSAAAAIRENQNERFNPVSPLSSTRDERARDVLRIRDNLLWLKVDPPPGSGAPGFGAGSGTGPGGPTPVGGYTTHEIQEGRYSKGTKVAPAGAERILIRENELQLNSVAVRRCLLAGLLAHEGRRLEQGYCYFTEPTERTDEQKKQIFWNNFLAWNMHWHVLQACSQPLIDSLGPDHPETYLLEDRRNAALLSRMNNLVEYNRLRRRLCP